MNGQRKGKIHAKGQVWTISALKFIMWYLHLSEKVILRDVNRNVIAVFYGSLNFFWGEGVSQQWKWLTVRAVCVF